MIRNHEAKHLINGKIGATSAGIVVNVPPKGGKVDALMHIKEGNGKELVIVITTIVDDWKIIRET